MEVSLFAGGARDRHPVRASWSLEDLGRELTTFRVVSVAKLDAPAWSPASYPPGVTRGGAGVLEVAALVLDVDDGTPIERVWALWSEHARVLHTSWSHTSAHPKCRLVVPLASPVPREGWSRVWAWASVQASRRGVQADPQCKDPSRLFFLPAVRSECHSRSDLVRPLLSVDWTRLVDPATVAQRRRAPLILPRGAQVPPRERWRDPAARERLARELGAQLRGHDVRADRVTCPACGRRSVWFYLRPYRFEGAACDHRRTCGWRGGLEALCRSTM